MTYYLTVPLQATYTKDVLEADEWEAIKVKFPTLEIDFEDDDQDESLVEAGFWEHNLSASDPMDLVLFLIHTGDLNKAGLWRFINEIEKS